MGSIGHWAAAACLAVTGAETMTVDTALAQPAQGLEEHNRALVAKGFGDYVPVSSGPSAAESDQEE